MPCSGRTTMERRIEHDLLGDLSIPAESLHGIHTQRALANFVLAERRVNPALIHAYGAVKLACARSNQALQAWPPEIFAAVEQACSEMMNGRLDRFIVVDALQGGAGTSTNMNVNEVIANRALQLAGHLPGQYHVIHPLDDINRHQSTNDTYPTAVKLAAVDRLRALAEAVVGLQEAFQAKEHEFADIVTIGRTQLQDAVLTTVGRRMSAYAEAFTRDRWRLYKCEERLRVVNLGGTAIGTGVGAPRPFIFRAVEQLRCITGIGLARAENLMDATQNADVFVEASGILKALACSLVKIGNDLRLLSSGPSGGFGELSLPARQAGSSIMPGKVNPVIPEAVVQAGMLVQGNDQVLCQAAAAGNLELNAFMPLVADMLLTNLDLLVNACLIFSENCIQGLGADRERCREQVGSATATVTALVGQIGYQNAQAVAGLAHAEGMSIRAAVERLGVLTGEQFDALVSPERVTALGAPAADPSRTG